MAEKKTSEKEIDTFKSKIMSIGGEQEKIKRLIKSKKIKSSKSNLGSNSTKTFIIVIMAAVCSAEIFFSTGSKKIGISDEVIFQKSLLVID